MVGSSGYSATEHLACRRLHYAPLSGVNKLQPGELPGTCTFQRLHKPIVSIQHGNYAPLVLTRTTRPSAVTLPLTPSRPYGMTPPPSLPSPHPPRCLDPFLHTWYLARGLWFSLPVVRWATSRFVPALASCLGIHAAPNPQPCHDDGACYRLPSVTPPSTHMTIPDGTSTVIYTELG